MTFGLESPRRVLEECIRASKADKSAPPGGLQLFYGIRMRLLERGLLDMHMTASAIDALFDEVADDLLKPEAPIDYERIHGKMRLQ